MDKSIKWAYHYFLIYKRKLKIIAKSEECYISFCDGLREIELKKAQNYYIYSLLKYMVE